MFRALQCPSSGARQTAVADSGFRMNVEVEVFSAVVGLLVTSKLTNRPWLRTLPPPHSYGKKRLQQQFDRLLMMGIVMPETCSAVSVRQSNKILRLIVAPSWVFYLICISLVQNDQILRQLPAPGTSFCSWDPLATGSYWVYSTMQN